MVFTEYRKTNLGQAWLVIVCLIFHAAHGVLDMCSEANFEGLVSRRGHAVLHTTGCVLLMWQPHTLGGVDRYCVSPAMPHLNCIDEADAFWSILAAVSPVRSVHSTAAGYAGQVRVAAPLTERPADSSGLLVALLGSRH
jgi:hypothetical protein